MASGTSTFDVFPALTQFRSDGFVQLMLEIPPHLDGNGLIEIAVLRRTEPIGGTTISVAQLHEQGGVVDIGSFAYGGYHVVARLMETGAQARTAFDVVRHWREAPRYAFLSDYYPRESHQDVQNFFRKFHLNVVQFYDWMERHDAPVPTTPEFVDPMGRKLVTSAILSRITAMRDIGCASLAYAAVYAALRDYAQAHPNDGLYANDGRQNSLIDLFYLMDITEGSPWREHILSEFARVIEFGFDGLHLDQYGYPKSALRKDGSVLWMDDAYRSFITACRQRLGEETGIIFNNVSSYPVHKTHQVEQDAMYVEVWPPMVRYRHLSQIIHEIRIRTEARKSVILAAYLKPFREQRDANPDAIARSALLVTAVIFASGGYHLVLGESGGMLTEPYYPDYVPMVPSLVAPLRAMYDVLTADGDLLASSDTTDVTWSFAGGTNDAVVVLGSSISVEPEAGHVWIRVVTTAQGLLVHLVNLTWLVHDEWNAIHDEPFSPSPTLDVRIEWNHPVREVLVQRTDVGGWESMEPQWVPHVRGQALSVTVPPIHFWTVVFVPYFAEGSNA